MDGIKAAGGTIALVSGTPSYLEYPEPGDPNAIMTLLGSAVTVGVGLALLLGAVSGTIAIGKEYGIRL